MNIKIDVIGKVCPTPVVETVKALRKAAKGDTVEITGTEKSSKAEIELLAKDFDIQLVVSEQNGDIWHIILKKTKDIS
jgi:TusA-related sulfurtransferase